MANNPMNGVDPDGRDYYQLNKAGQVVHLRTTNDPFHIVWNSNGDILWKSDWEMLRIPKHLQLDFKGRQGFMKDWNLLALDIRFGEGGHDMYQRAKQLDWNFAAAKGLDAMNFRGQQVYDKLAGNFFYEAIKGTAIGLAGGSNLPKGISNMIDIYNTINLITQLSNGGKGINQMMYMRIETPTINFDTSIPTLQEIQRGTTGIADGDLDL
jgi:hypothetical protein